MKMKVVCVSDTHGLHNELPEIPDGDLLIHAGDFSWGRPKDYMLQLQIAEAMNKWFGSLPHKHKILVAGNHDFLPEVAEKKFREIMTNVTYLCNEDVTIDGFKVYGTPYQPWFYDWAFNVRDEQEREIIFSQIPDDTDILVTHSPPYGILDKTMDWKYAGCKALLRRAKKVEPLLHVFGHIHEAAGVDAIDGKATIFLNASVLDENYRIKGKIKTLELINNDQ